MRKLVFTGMLFSIALIFVGQQKVSAANIALDLALAGSDELESQTFIHVIPSAQSETEQVSATEDLTSPQADAQQQLQTEHRVEAGESLSKIAGIYGTTWRRIYDKNTSVDNPDHLLPGTVLLIPTEDEVLEPRALPTPPRAVVVTRNQTESAVVQPRYSVPVARGSSDGNRYVAGYCTWYVKNRRPDLPNNLGNAITWVSRAAAQGLPTGSTPVPGAVGQRGNHVVYVESVNGDGTINISDMNYKGLYVITHRTVPANQFTYIY